MDGLIVWVSKRDQTVCFCSIEVNKTRYMWLNDDQNPSQLCSSPVPSTFVEMERDGEYKALAPKETTTWLD